MRQAHDFVIDLPTGLNIGDTVFDLGITSLGEVLELRGGAHYPGYGAGQFIPFGYNSVSLSAFIDGDILKVRIGNPALVPAKKLTLRIVVEA